jgi:hypothetical protein
VLSLKETGKKPRKKIPEESDPHRRIPEGLASPEKTVGGTTNGKNRFLRLAAAAIKEKVEEFLAPEFLLL